MNSRSPFVKKCCEKFCSWGTPTRIPSQDYIGGPVPLLVNPAKKMFMIFAIINVVFTVMAVSVASVQYFLNFRQVTDDKHDLEISQYVAYADLCG